MQRAHRVSTRVLGAVLFLIGIAMIATSTVRGGGPLAVGVIAGLAFAVLGWLRFSESGREG